jgi:hypothetical protein
MTMNAELWERLQLVEETLRQAQEVTLREVDDYRRRALQLMGEVVTLLAAWEYDAENGRLYDQRWEHFHHCALLLTDCWGLCLLAAGSDASDVQVSLATHHQRETN